jgi:hypothetical protein
MQCSDSGRYMRLLCGQSSYPSLPSKPESRHTATCPSDVCAAEKLHRLRRGHAEHRCSPRKQDWFWLRLPRLGGSSPRAGSPRARHCESGRGNWADVLVSGREHCVASAFRRTAGVRLGLRGVRYLWAGSCREADQSHIGCLKLRGQRTRDSVTNDQSSLPVTLRSHVVQCVKRNLAADIRIIHSSPTCSRMTQLLRTRRPLIRPFLPTCTMHQ